MSRLRILLLSFALIVGLLISSVSQTMAQGNSYTVQPGDTLFSIAMRYGTTPDLLMAFNGLSSPMIYVGQVLTVPSTPTGAPPAPAASSGTIVVQEGDTLFSLATRHGMTVATIKALNGLSTDYIYIGQVLKISENVAAPASVPPPPPVAAAFGTYIVQPNDTLYNIAVRYGSSVYALKKANGLIDDQIYVGQVLNVSNNTTAPAAPNAVAVPVVPAPAAPAAPVSSGIYIVQPGDTLFRIALGHNTTVAALKALNGLTSDNIFAGQAIKVSSHVEVDYPPSPPNEPHPPYPHTEKNEEPRHGEAYIVLVGDTLTLIATRYKTTVDALIRANRLTSDIILIGQSLIIPDQQGHRAPPPPESQGTYYTVQGGDTLSQIAAKWGISLGALAQLNNLRSNNWIYIGQRLLIPKGVYAPAPPPAVVPPSVPGKEYYHIVRPGETLSQIAWHYNTSVDAIVEANHLANANQIFIGQRLYISGYHPPAAKPLPQPAPSATPIPPTVTAIRPTATPIRPTYPPATATTARRASSATTVAPSATAVAPSATAVAPSATAVAPSATAVAPSATANPPMSGATSTPVVLAPSATAINGSSAAPYVPPASEQPPALQPATPAAPPLATPQAAAPQATAPQAAAPQAVWTAQVFNEECGTEDTRHFTSAVRVNVEGREEQEVDLFAYPIQESNLVTWGKTGSKAVLGPFGVEFAPLGAGNYAISVPEVGTSPSFYVDGDCIAYINFALTGP